MVSVSHSVFYSVQNISQETCDVKQCNLDLLFSEYCSIRDLGRFAFKDSAFKVANVFFLWHTWEINIDLTLQTKVKLAFLFLLPWGAQPNGSVLAGTNWTFSGKSDRSWVCPGTSRRPCCRRPGMSWSVRRECGSKLDTGNLYHPRVGRSPRRRGLPAPGWNWQSWWLCCYGGWCYRSPAVACPAAVGLWTWD